MPKEKSKNIIWKPYNKDTELEDGRYLVAVKPNGLIVPAYFKICSYSNDLSKVNEYDFPKTRFEKVKGFYNFIRGEGYILERNVIYYTEIPELP